MDPSQTPVRREREVARHTEQSWVSQEGRCSSLTKVRTGREPSYTWSSLVTAALPKHNIPIFSYKTTEAQKDSVILPKLPVQVAELGHRLGSLCRPRTGTQHLRGHKDDPARHNLHPGPKGSKAGWCRAEEEWQVAKGGPRDQWRRKCF